LAFRPPDGLTGRRRQPGALAWFGQPHRFVFDQFSDGEAVMRLDEGKVVERDAGLLQRLVPGVFATLEG
jgi:hypothetical protein